MKILKSLTPPILLTVLFTLIWPYLPTTDHAAYFHFADQSQIFGIPHFYDVMSNLGFLWAGIYGIILVKKKYFELDRRISVIYLSFSIANILTCFGSMYFHWNPNPTTLVWDRLPMTLAFSSLLSIIIFDRYNLKKAYTVLLLSLPLGILTVFGYADGIFGLKPYIVLQFGSILYVVFTLLTCPARKISNSIWWQAVGFYALAKILEVVDKPLFEVTSGIAGHPLKHIAAAISTYLLIRTIKLL